MAEKSTCLPVGGQYNTDCLAEGRVGENEEWSPAGEDDGRTKPDEAWD